MLSTFVREKQTEPEVTQMFKYSWCPPVKPGPRPGAARPGPARPHACTAELNTEIGCFLTAFLFNHRKEALSDAKQVGPLIKLFTVILWPFQHL